MSYLIFHLKIIIKFFSFAYLFHFFGFIIFHILIDKVGQRLVLVRHYICRIFLISSVDIKHLQVRTYIVNVVRETGISKWLNIMFVYYMLYNIQGLASSNISLGLCIKTDGQVILEKIQLSVQHYCSAEYLKTSYNLLPTRV